MGLALEVGILADQKKNDAEGFEMFRAQFDDVNKLLAAEGLPRHDEPEDCEIWSGEMIGYSGLHYLRRIAAHIDAGRRLPGPGDGKSSEDELLEAYFGDVTKATPGFLGSLLGKKTFARQFDHLIVHSDAEGFYLPLEFENVLFSPAGLEIPGGMVGSAPQLLSECERLAKLLEIPADITLLSEELWEASDHSQGEGDTVWEQYGVESFSCVALMEGCRQALKTGAALVFT